MPPRRNRNDWLPRGSRTGLGMALLLLCTPLHLDCARSHGALRYRLSGSGEHWDVVGGDRVVDDLRLRYPDFFDVILDPENLSEPDLKLLRDDLERSPVGRRNYDALNTIAVGYFELNYRAEADRGGRSYLADSYRATKLLAVPWKAYGLVSEPTMRNAILDFFEDVASGEKLGSASTAPRLTRIVSSLEAKENDPGRAARIRTLVARLEALSPEEGEE